jgi:nonsense-mediated mRNA decay protein 3
MRERKIRENICPSCGGPSRNAGACDRCRAGKTEWFSCEGRAESIGCPACGAVKSAGVWSDTPGERSALAPEVARRAIKFHPDLVSPGASFSITDISVNRSVADVTLSGVLYGEQVTGHCLVEILWQKEQCDRCNRISGDYHEGVIQVRAEGRRPYRWETERAVLIAYGIEDEMQSGGERLSFIAGVDEHRDGVDITVGSQQIGQAIAQEVIRRLGGRMTTHPKLVGEKAGRRLYRITWSIRLPRFVKGDIIGHDSGYWEVVQADSRSIRYRDLKNGNLRSARTSDGWRLVGNARDALVMTVAYLDGDTVGLIEPGTGRTIEIMRVPWIPVFPGDQVRVLRDGEHFIAVG